MAGLYARAPSTLDADILSLCRNSVLPVISRMLVSVSLSFQQMREVCVMRVGASSRDEYAFSRTNLVEVWTPYGVKELSDMCFLDAKGCHMRVLVYQVAMSVLRNMHSVRQTFMMLPFQTA